MYARTLAAVLLAACSLATTAVAQDTKSETPKQVVYKTPAAVFEAYFDALNKRDTKATIGCLTPKAIESLAGLYAVQGQQKRELAQTSGKDGAKDDKLLKRWQPLFDVLDKYGLTPAATKDVKIGLRPTAAELEKAKASLLAPIKDRAAFLADYQDALDKDAPKGKEEELKVRLTEVAIDGDKATGVGIAKYLVKAKDKDKLKEIEVEDSRIFDFVKVGDGWKIVPTSRPKQEKKQ